MYHDTGRRVKGLAVYKSMRGTNDLENFHKHCLNFIPGKEM